MTTKTKRYKITNRVEITSDGPWINYEDYKSLEINFERVLDTIEQVLDNTKFKKKKVSFTSL